MHSRFRMQFEVFLGSLNFDIFVTLGIYCQHTICYFHVSNGLRNIFNGIDDIIVIQCIRMTNDTHSLFQVYFFTSLERVSLTFQKRQKVSQIEKVI